MLEELVLLIGPFAPWLWLAPAGVVAWLFNYTRQDVSMRKSQRAVEKEKRELLLWRRQCAGRSQRARFS